MNLAKRSERMPERSKSSSVWRTQESGESETLHTVFRIFPPRVRPRRNQPRSAARAAKVASRKRPRAARRPWVRAAAAIRVGRAGMGRPMRSRRTLPRTMETPCRASWRRMGCMAVHCGTAAQICNSGPRRAQAFKRLRSKSHDLRVLDRPPDRQRLLQQCDCLSGLPETGIRHSKIPQSAALAAAVPDLAMDHQSLLVVPDRLLHFAQAVVGTAQVPQSVALLVAVPDIPSDDQLLLVVPDCLLHLTQARVRQAQVPQSAALPSTIPNFPSDHQSLLVVPERLLQFAQVVVGQAQVPQSVALPAAVPDLASDHESLLVVPDGLLHLAQAVVGRAQVPQIAALSTAVPDLAMDHQSLLVGPDRLLHLAQIRMRQA